MAVSLRAVDPDRFDRVVKLLVDAGDAPTFAAAAELLRTYRIQITADARACADPAWQAALLTAVNTGVRAVHGGVRVRLDADPIVQAPWARGRRLSAALRELGAGGLERAHDDVPTIVFGDDAASRTQSGRAPILRPIAGRWTAELALERIGAGQTTPSVLGAVLAANLAVSEAFQWLRGNAVAGEREIALSLWDPEGGAEGPPIAVLPAETWLLGLGHLGQAYAWLLGLLPYPIDGNRNLVLQDDDRVSEANRATSLLHRAKHLGMRKTRLVGAALEPLGWDARLIEHRYHGGRLHALGDPGVLLSGLDNPQARHVLDEFGMALIYDAGLGAGPDGYLGMTIRRLPGGGASRTIWPTAPPPAPTPSGAREAYAALEVTSGDRCGVERLAGRTVATSFVGSTAACWVIGSLLRELHGGQAFGLIDYSLRDPATVLAIQADVTPPRVPSVPCRS
jgi:hypothetical protein